MNRRAVIGIGILVTGVFLLCIVTFAVWAVTLPVLIIRPSLASPFAEWFMAKFTREVTRAMMGRK